MARETREAWVRRVERWQRSGLTADRFAEQENVNARPLAFWIDTAAEQPLAKIVITGGKRPYLAEWKGNSPGNRLPLNGVDHSQGVNRGIITLRPLKNAKGSFQLLVSDQASSSVTTVVTPQGTAQTAGPATSSLTPGPSLPPIVLQGAPSSRRSR